jgi:hypothetical protein
LAGEAAGFDGTSLFDGWSMPAQATNRVNLACNLLKLKVNKTIFWKWQLLARRMQ